ncbi:YbhB/YbcL family Raf kinase inhibitor-like protein [Methanoculleus sp. 7T]|jgi:Raf kinase inhibitor-like YbhB/YbcL family protein|uniref:YbhB/YbcL family Raf kinase inhibitor-like protein n=1 Tax=Methanoculleus sp. 7T TaxID=2937282 RepID=UPI0020BD80FD|nr:YbhB/YbcL family Raf kinase inhibitor-like protein [Methanoculleus sp. 7T]MCK8518247.1 YbhB/YbcL family Raf kinase inhibitor-like protein [Methanoculleus sp. 7T]
MPRLTLKLDFEEFPAVYTCKGANRSPPIRVEGILPNIKSLAVLATTSPEDGPSKVAWVLWNLPAVPLIPEGFPGEGVVESPLHAVQGTNDFGTIGYRGPCPEAGEAEAYLFRVYALDLDLALAPGATWEEMIRAMEGSMNQSGEVIAFATG